MLQHMDKMAASCIFYIKVGMLDQLEKIKIRILTITEIGIAMLSMEHDFIFSLCFM